MINVYLQGTTTFDNNGEATLIPLSCEFTVGINNAWSFEMEHPYDKEDRYLKLVKDAILRVTGIDFIREWESTSQMLRIYDVKKTLTSVSVIAFPLGMEAQYDAPIEYLYTGANKTGVQAAAMLDDYVKTHDGNNKYTISSDVTETNASGVEWNNTNLIAAIANDFVSDEDGWGGEVVYDNYKIKIRANIGHYNESNPFPVRYGRNLTGLEHEIDSSNIVTRLYPISSDDLRLNDYTDTTHQSGLTYVDSSLISSYPFIRCAFVDIPRKLVDTTKNSNDPTAILTAQLTTTMYNKMYEKAEALWTAVCNDLTNTRNATYLKTLINGKDGEDGIIQYLQRKFVFKSASFQSLVKSTAKQAVEWIKSEDVPKWEWHENTEVIPHAWWYGDNSVTPATSYAKNCYVLIGKRWEWFNDDGYWVDYKYIPNEDVEWQEAQDDSGRKWFGYKKGYYAHNEYVYMTVEGQMKEWFYDSDGWYVEDSSGDSNKDWHQDSYGYWFGEEGATADDKSKYIHDRWAFIDGTYYWFDTYGYINADPERSFPDWPWGNQETSEGSLWFGNDSDHGMNAKWLANQWAKIDGEWWYFDSDGYAVDMNNVKSATIAWFADEVYNYSISTIKDCLEDAYEFLYGSMTSWCEGLYAQGLDKPTVNVSVDLIDLSKTAEYAEYAPLEKICLGDNVKVVGRDGLASEARVVGLTYDCIRGYNTKVEIGQLSKTVGQIISNNFKGTDNSSKLVAGDNVIIEQRSNGAQIITVADYTGRTIGLQDVTMNGASVVSGNVAGFNIAAGDNISISRDGRTLTISGEGGGSNIYYGTTPPASSLGVDRDAYFQLDYGLDGVFEDISPQNHITITNSYLDNNGFNADISGSPISATTAFQDSIVIKMNGLKSGNQYTVSCDLAISNTAELMPVPPYSYNYIHIGNQTTLNNDDNHGFRPTYAIQQVEGYGGHYEFTFTADDEQNIHIGFDFLDLKDNVNFTATIRNLRVNIAKVTAIYCKVGNTWEKYEGGETYTAGSNIDITNNVISAPVMTGATASANGASGAVPQPLIADKDKVLKGDGTWGTAGAEVEANPSGTATATLQKVDIDGTIYEIQGGGGGGSNLILDAIRYTTTEKQVGIWIDGKPLYQKTISCGALPNNTTKTIAHGVSNIDFIANGWGYADNGTQLFPIPFVNNDNIGSQVVLYITRTDITLKTTVNRSTFTKTYVTIQYTKTTDAAGSGGYQAYGFSPIIYSTEEREVGVWIDNKPLYQKSTYFGAISSGANYGLTMDIGANIVDTVIDIFANAKVPSGAWVVLPYPLPNANYAAYLDGYNKSTDKLTIKTGNDRSFVEGYATIYYTKTTDTAGSGSYNTLGVPTVNYSTDEQVIGTWMGETLYQACVATGGSVPSGATLIERTAMASTGYDTIKYTKTTD